MTLISQQATLLASNEAFKKQAESASEAAKKYMEENDQLKKVSSACQTPPCDILYGHSGHCEPVSDIVVVGKAKEFRGGAKGSSQWGPVREAVPFLLSHLYLLCPGQTLP